MSFLRAAPWWLSLALVAGCDFRDELESCIQERVCIDETLSTGFVTGGNGQPLGSFLTPAGQRQPRLVEWTPAVGAGEYQFQAVACPSGPLEACPFEEGPTFENVGPSTFLTVPFPLKEDGIPYVGRYAYRVRPCRTDGDLACGRWTDVRYFRAGHPAGPFPGDLTGDGRADVVAGDPGFSLNAGAVTLFHWTGSGFTSTPVETSILGSTASFGASVAHVGDVNADGVGDLLVGGAMGTTAYVILGGTTLGEPVALNSQGGGFPASVAAGGDFNGDGYADALISSHESDANTFILLYLGGASGLATTPALTLSPPSTGGVIGLTMTALDLDLDGLDDVLASTESGVVYVYFGRRSLGGNMTPDLIVQPTQPEAQFGRTVLGAGDLDADGVEDLLVQGAGDRLHIFGGNELQLLTVGHSDGAAVAGYLNGDGFADALSFKGGSYELYPGGPQGLTGPSTFGAGNTLLLRAAVTGDVDGDGSEDVVFVTDDEPEVWFSPDRRSESFPPPTGATSAFGSALAPIR